MRWHYWMAKASLRDGTVYMIGHLPFVSCSAHGGSLYLWPIMKAFFLTTYSDAHTAFELRGSLDHPPGQNEVAIAVDYFGLNFADVLARRGLYREAPPLPYIPGYDVTGRIVDLGSGVSDQWLGKRVVALVRFGAYASRCVASISGCVEIPEEMPAADACALGTQYCTAYYAACYASNAFPGDRVLVHAAMGGVGIALVQLLKWKGCIVYATAGSDDKVEQLRAMGIQAINYIACDYAEELEKLLNGQRLDACFNSIAGDTFRKDMRLLGAGGKLVLYGFAQRAGKKGGKWATLRLLWDMGVVMPILLMATSKSIVGVNMLKIADHRPLVIQHCLSELVKLWKQGVIRPVAGGVFEAHELAKAHELLESRSSVGKLIVKAPA
jgi:NADPH:quinone reductase-like Zn-dependent oxidoreductase